MRIGLYARVSTLAQGEEDKASIPEQITRIEEYCQKKEYVIADRYVDIGYSGAKSKRPEFQRMLADAKIGRFDAIVCWKADRLSRGMYPAAALMEVIEPLNISLEAVEEHLDTNYFGMLAMIGKMELDNIKVRTQMGREARIKKGKVHGKPPYGYNYNKPEGCFIINEDEAKIVRFVFQQYLQGVPIRKVARLLNNDAVPTQKSCKYGWTVTKITEMVSRSCYCGEAYYNKRFGATNKRKEKSKWLAMQIPPIVSKEMFELAQSQKHTNNRFSPRKTKMVYLLQHILFCEECGMHFYAFNRAHGRRSYICRGIQEYPHIYSCRMPKHLPGDKIDQKVWNKIAETLRKPAMFKTAIKNRLQSLSEEIGNQETHLKEANEKIQKFNLEESWVITQARKGKFDEQQMDLQLRAIREDKEMTMEDIRKLKECELLQSKQTDVLEQVQKICDDLKEVIDSLDTLQNEEVQKRKQAIIRLLINKVTVNNSGKVTIQFAIPEPDEIAIQYASLCGVPITQGSFDYATSPRVRPHRYRLDCGGDRVCANLRI